jgi:hypothetical protein
VPAGGGGVPVGAADGVGPGEPDDPGAGEPDGAGAGDGELGPVQAAPASTAASSTPIRAARAAGAARRPRNATAEL